MDELELALDDCLQQLASGTSSLGQCLARYPRYAKELRPLLETALRLQQGKAVRPSGAMRDRARAELADYIKAHPKHRKAPAIPKLAVGMIALVLAMTIVSTAFAQGALPGQALYRLKLSSERAWRATAGDPVAVDLRLADRRTIELITVSQNLHSEAYNAAAGADPAETEAIDAYTDVLVRIAPQSTGPDGSKILEALEGNQTALSKAGIHVPELDDIVDHAKANKDKGKGHDGQGNGNGQGNGPNP